MSPAKQNEYFTRALEFIKAKFGGAANILTAVVHRDESTPHMQVIIAPVDQHGRFSASKMVGNRSQLSQLQDDFWEACGKPHGLDRGIKRSEAKHVPVRAFYGAMDRGLDPPKYMPVPPAPGMTDRLKPGYQAKKEAHQAALDHNKKVRAQVHETAKAVGQVHPAILGKQASRYRQALELEALAKQQYLASEQAKKDAQKALEQAKTAQQEAKIDRQEAVHDVAVVRQALDEQGELKRLLRAADTIAKNADPRYLQKIGHELGIDLKPGVSVLDQVRRGLGLTGQASTLEALRHLDNAAEGVGSESVSAAAWRQIHREDDSPAPGM